MEAPQTIAAIDVGTTKVCTIVAARSKSGRLEVIAHATVPSDGMRKGSVVSVDGVRKSVRASVAQVEQAMGRELVSAYVGVTGAHIAFQNRRDAMDWAGGIGVVTARDVDRLPSTAAREAATPGRRVLHTIPMQFTLDESRGIRNPVGMHGTHVEVETHVVSGDSPLMDRLVEAVEGTGLRVSGLVLEPLASGHAVLTPSERERGAVVVDIGGGTTDVVVFQGNRACYTAVIPVGGFQFTNDICVAYGAPYAAAEEVKVRYASVDPFSVRLDEMVPLPRSGGTADRPVLRRDICQLVRERSQELVNLVALKLREAALVDMATVPLALTGGAANLPGLMDMARRSLSRRTRLGIPEAAFELPEALKSPAYATAVGILAWAASQSTPPVDALGMEAGMPGEERDGFLARVLGRLAAWLPAVTIWSSRGRNR